MRRKNKKIKDNPRHRGIYVLPNLFTTLNAFCGFFAIISALENHFTTAAVSILGAVFFDILDGKIARLTNATSRFGVEYDSLSDLISFGIGSALVMYLWALKPMGRIGWLAAFLFTICGALRLARFNTQAGQTSGNYFTGLPIPAAAGMCATTILFFNRFNISVLDQRIIILIMTYCLSFLMVSTIRYNSFKHPEIYRKIKFNVLVTVVLILIFIAAMPAVALFFLGVVYILSGPLNLIRRQCIKKNLVDNNKELEQEHSDLINS